MNHILWFRQVLEAAIQLYFRQEEVTVNSIYDIPAPEGNFWQKICGTEPAFDEQVVLMLALMPHLCPQMLDIFFANTGDFCLRERRRRSYWPVKMRRSGAE